MDISQFRRTNNAIRNSFAAVKQDMFSLRRELAEINQAVAAGQEFEDEAALQLEGREKDIKELSNKILSLKEELHNEQLQARRALNRLQQNFESIYVGIDAYKTEAQALREENKKLKALIEAFMQEIAQNKDISISALRGILNELKIETHALKGGVIKLASKKGKKRKEIKEIKEILPSISMPSISSIPSKFKEQEPGHYDISFDEPKPKKKGFFSRVVDYFAEEE